MSDDNLRIKPNHNSTVERKQIKPDNEKIESGEARPAEIQVGQELTKSSKTTSDVQTEQPTEQRVAQKEAEEAANIADIESMAELPDDTTDNADSNKEKALTERTNDLKNLSAEEKRRISAMTQKELALMTNEALKGKYERAERDFNAQLKHDGWTGDVADAFSKIWNNKLYGNKNGNTADLVREDLAKFKKDMEKLNSASQLGPRTYTREFKKIFGVEFNSLNIAAYQKAEATYIEALSAKRLEDAVNSELDILLYDDKLNEEYKTYVGLGGMPVTYVSATKKDVFERDYKKLTDILGSKTKEILDKRFKDEKAETFDAKYKILHQVAKSLSELLSHDTKAKCRGKNIEDVKKEYETTYQTAFGVKNDIAKRVNDYNVSQQKGAGIVQSVAVIGAVTVTCLSMGTAAPLGATALASAGTATVATGVVNVSDRYTSGIALDELKNKGFMAYLKKGAEITDWNQIVKASVTSGAMALLFAGQSYAVSNLCIKAGMSATSAAVVNSAAFIGTGLGTEKLLTGEITVEGATFTVLMAVVGGVLQIRQIKKQEAAIGTAKETKLSTDINNARETMGFSKDAIITPEQLETQWKAMAKKIHPDTGGSDIAMATLNSAHDTLKANIARINDFIGKTSKTIAGNQNQTKQQTPFATDEVTGHELIPAKTTPEAKPATIALPLTKGEETAVTIANTGFNESVHEYNVAALVPQNETPVEYTETPVIKNPTHETTKRTTLQETETSERKHLPVSESEVKEPTVVQLSTDEKMQILSKKMEKLRNKALSKEDLSDENLRANVDSALAYLENCEKSGEHSVSLRPFKIRALNITPESLKSISTTDWHHAVLARLCTLGYPMELLNLSYNAGTSMNKIPEFTPTLSLGADKTYGENLIDWYQKNTAQSGELNNSLRQGKELSEKAKELMRFFDSHQRALGKNMGLIRGTTDYPGMEISKLKPSDEFTDNGFSSTMHADGIPQVLDAFPDDFGNFEHFIIIKAPATQKVIVPADWAGNDSMGEVILPRGTKFRVIDNVSLTDYGSRCHAKIEGRRAIIVEIVENEPKTQPLPEIKTEQTTPITQTPEQSKSVANIKTATTAQNGIKSCFDPKNFDAETVEILDKQMAKTREICKKTFHPERFKKAEEMGLFKPIYSKSPEKQLPLMYIEELTIQTPENVQNYFELIEHSNPNVPAEDILGIAITSSPEVIARVKEMMYIPERGDNQLEVNLEFATQLSIQSDAKFKRTRELAYIPQRGSHQYSTKDIMDIELALISDEIYQRAKEHKLFDYNPAFEQLGINVNDIEYMAIFFTETNFKHFDILLELNPQMNLDKKTLMKLADMDREQIMKALPLIIEYKNTRSAVEIAELSKNLKDFQIPYLEWALKHNGEYEIKATSKAFRMKNHEHFIGIGGDAETQIYTIGIRETKTKLQLIKTKDGLFIADASTESSVNKPAENEKDKKLAEKAAYLKKIRKLNCEPKSYQVDDLIEFIKTGDLSGEVVYKADTPFSEGHAEITLPDTKSKISKTPIAEISQLDTAPGQKNAERIVYRYNQDGTTVVNDWGTGLYMKLSPKENGVSVIEAVGNKEIRLSSEIKDGMIKITNDTTGETFITSLQPLIDSRTLQRKLLKIETIPDAQREERLTQLFKKLNPTTILNMLKLKKTFPDMQFPFIENALESFCGGEMKTLNAASEVTLSDSRETVAHEAEHGITDYYDLTSNEELLALHKKEGEINKGIIRYLSQYATDGQMGDRQRGLSELSSIMTAADEYGAELGSRVEATRKAFPQTTKALAEHRMLHYENLLYEFRLTEKAPAKILYRANKNGTEGRTSGLISQEDDIIPSSSDEIKLLEEKIIQSGSEQKQANTKIYKENYLTNINVMPEIKAKCLEIAENFGVYIFVNNESTAETLEAISHIEDELLAWESAKGKTETFNHPTIININASNSATLKSNSDEIVNINASSIVNVGRLIRYEMLKRNTTTDIPWLKDNVIKEVMPQKGLLHKRIDIDNCKYIEELVKAGINPELIEYAYTSPEDFVTIALTGNKSAYSEEFRKVLMTLGASELSLRVGNTENPIPFSSEEIKTRTDAIKNSMKAKSEERILAKMLSPERAAKLKAEYITSLLAKNTELDAIFHNTDIDSILAKTQGLNGKTIDKGTILSNLRVLNIPISEIKEFYDAMKSILPDEDIFKKLIQTLDVYPTIKNHQFFNLIPLTFKDVFTLKEAFQRNFYPSQEISDIIEAKEDLYLYEVSEKILSPSNLNEFKELSKKLTDRSSLIFSKVQFLPQIQINGKPLNLRVKKRFEIPNTSTKQIDNAFLIDCNMFTLELLENPKIAEAAIKHFGSDISYAKIGDVKFEYPIETKSIIEKLKSGKTLISQETHALTEILLKLYSDFPEIKEEIDIVMNTENAKAKKDNISNLITAIRNEIGELPKGIEISDHFILRMVDRNILTALSLKSEYEYSIRDLFYQMLEDAKKVQKEGNSTVALDSEKEITPRIEFKIDKQNEKITFGTIVN